MNPNMSFGWAMRCVGAAGILLRASAGAQTAPAGAPAAVPPAAVSTNVQDYSQGFGTFVRMGLPDTSKAKYVKLDSYGASMFDMITYSMQEIQLSGNAWLVSENKDDKSVLVSSTGRTLRLFDQKTFTKKQEAEARSNAVAKASAAEKDGAKPAVGGLSRRGGDLAQTGTWAPADLSRDLTKATAFVDKKIKAKAAGGRETRYDSFLQSDEASGTLFLLAVFAWQNGKVQEANVLAGSLFTLVGDSRKVIVGALNVMADAQLAVTAEDFQTTHDWKAYHASVSALLKKYPVGWRKAGAVKMLADRLLARAAMAEPPAVKGEGLGDEDLKLAAALASECAPEGRYSSSGELWILPPDKAMRGMKDDSVTGRIKARGLKSVPLLIALVPDETFCPQMRNDRFGRMSYYSSSDSEKSEAERAQTDYNRMNRPLTRGEIARSMLAPLCPREENARHDEDEATPEEVVDAAKQAYATLKALSPEALAQHFLNKGDSSQKQAAIGYLLQSDVEANAPKIEAFLLAPPSEEAGVIAMGADSGLVQQYVEKRGEKAAEFVEKYAAMRKKIELPAGMAGNDKYVKQMEKRAEREIKTLRAMVKKQDLSETVSALANSDDENESAMMAYSALGRQPPDKAVPALLAVAVQATNVAARARILQMMPMLRYSGMREEIQEGASSESMEAAMKSLAEKNKLNIGTNAAAWKLLLADTRVMPEGRMYSDGEYEMTIADMAATDIETLYAATSLMEQFGGREGLENLRPEVAMKVTRARAAARLAGKPEDQLPKMPSADDVAADRRKAIDAEVLKAAPAALGAFLDKLTDSESLYLAEAAEENEAIMKVLAPRSRRIVAVKTAPELPAAEAAQLKKLVDTTISTNAIAEMREVCKRQLAQGKPVSAKLSSSGLGKGLALNVTLIDGTALRDYGSISVLNGKGRKPKGIVTGILRGGETSGYGEWLVDMPASFAPTGTVTAAAADKEDESEDRMESVISSLESQQEAFETAVEAFCVSDEALGQSTAVMFTGMLPPKAKDKKKGSDDDDEEEGDEGIDPFM